MRGTPLHTGRSDVEILDQRFNDLVEEVVALRGLTSRLAALEDDHIRIANFLEQQLGVEEARKVIHYIPTPWRLKPGPRPRAKPAPVEEAETEVR